MNGFNVVECDYSSFHPTMLYAMAKVLPPQNIYIIDKQNDAQLRQEYKTVMLVAINHRKPKTLWNAVAKNFRTELGYKKGCKQLKKRYIMNIFHRLVKHNQPIAKYMNKGVAMRLMRFDSEIADRIIQKFTLRRWPIRCVHDSFIVPVEYEDILREYMIKSFQDVMKTTYRIDVTPEKHGQGVVKLLKYLAKKQRRKLRPVSGNDTLKSAKAYMDCFFQDCPTYTSQTTRP